MQDGLWKRPGTGARLQSQFLFHGDQQGVCESARVTCIMCVSPALTRACPCVLTLTQIARFVAAHSNEY